VAEEKIRNHAQQGLDSSHEVMGLMVGGLFSWEGREYTLVRDVVTTDLESDLLGVRFHADGFSGLIDSLDDLDFNYRIVGWYHSHPGIGCFLSHIDHGTQRGIFNQPHHSALVLDPMQKELELYCGTELTSFRIYWDKFQNPC
jgi:proteasome lid subunit RPN8/RPN11